MTSLLCQVLAPIDKFPKIFARMIGIHQVKRKHKIPLHPIQTLANEKEQPACEILQNARKTTKKFLRGAKTENSQNASFPEN